MARHVPTNDYYSLKIYGYKHQTTKNGDFDEVPVFI